jgi:hypothetical protein
LLRSSHLRPLCQVLNHLAAPRRLCRSVQPMVEWTAAGQTHAWD